MSERRAFGLVIRLVGYYVVLAAVAWLYMRTKPKVRYDGSLVQTVIVLPIVIAGVVLIIRDSVALAFSLAGIVAAVRFRNTLRDTKDAVYIFLAIAVGLAAGVQAFSVAFVVTVIYLAVVLVLWRFDVGAEPPAERFRGRLIVEAAWAPGLEPAMVGILERYTRHWKLLRTEPTALTFAVQLRREGSPEGLVAAVREEATQQVTGARFEPNVS